MAPAHHVNSIINHFQVNTFTQMIEIRCVCVSLCLPLPPSAGPLPPSAGPLPLIGRILTMKWRDCHLLLPL